jgi:class 3 adenylate cyclase
MPPPASSLPTGTLTFLFTDIEGSTRLLQELGATYRRVQDDHQSVLRQAITAARGVEIRTDGDSPSKLGRTAFRSGSGQASIPARACGVETTTSAWT